MEQGWKIWGGWIAQPLLVHLSLQQSWKVTCEFAVALSFGLYSIFLHLKLDIIT